MSYKSSLWDLRSIIIGGREWVVGDGKGENTNFLKDLRRDMGWEVGILVFLFIDVGYSFRYFLDGILGEFFLGVLGWG